jgi:two-component system phosphate regulon response regulator OmpR
MRVLVIEDEKKTASFIRKALQAEGFAVDVCHRGDDALAAAAHSPFDGIVLDIMLPGRDGLSVLKQLRSQKNQTPVLLLSARGAVNERVEGLNAGADDYLPKPFEPRELVLRIRALLRRAPAVVPAPTGPVRIGTASFDLDRGELIGPSGPIRLTGGEAALLTALATRPGEILSREDIAVALGTDDAGERAVDVQVTRLRRKIEADPREPRFLHTVRGRGYVLKPGI